MRDDRRYIRIDKVCDMTIRDQIEDRYDKNILPLTHRIEVYDDLGIETEDSLYLRNELDRAMANIKIILHTGTIISN